MELKLIGKVKLILDLQSWDSGFTKREFVITTNEQYPQDVKLECIKDKTSLLDGLSEGDDVEVSFNVRGNEYNGKYYVNLQAWRLTNSGGAESINEPPPSEPDFEPVGDDKVRLRLDQVEFNALVSWLGVLESDKGIVAVDISLDSASSGYVSVRLNIQG